MGQQERKLLLALILIPAAVRNMVRADTPL
jgi:hypothetical protein